MQSTTTHRKTLRSRLGLAWAVLATMTLLFPSCKDDEKIFKEGPAELSAQVAYDWIDLQLELTKTTPGFTAPVAARAFGYTGLGLYEALRYGMQGNRSMSGQVSDFSALVLPEADPFKTHNWGAVANTTMASLLRGLYPNATDAMKAKITALEDQYATTYRDESSDKEYERSIELASGVADAMLTYAASDGQGQAFNNNYPTSYVPPVGPGLWEPTAAGFSPALQPNWGNVRPFLTVNVGFLVIPPPPAAYNTDTASYFVLEAREVYNIVNNPTTEQRTVADYWGDAPGVTWTGPGHNVSIMKQLLESADANLGTVAEVYARTGMALHDAMVVAFKTKYQFNYIRPVTAIRDLIDSNWSPYLETSPSPGYVSSNATQTGAACVIFVEEFGEVYTWTDRTNEGRTDIDGTPRTYTSFPVWANEVTDSRLYAGNIFRSNGAAGLEQGVKVGNNIMTLKFK
jgi:hypothetical protein